MTPSDAAGLAILARRDRRLVAALLRVLTGRHTDQDLEALPPRGQDEAVLDWACRARPAPVVELGAVRRAADQQLEAAAARGIQAIAIGHPSYPPRLAAIADPPAVLWVRGQVAATSDIGIAIVGSRAATPYGLRMAERIGADLAAAGLVIVSGLARGVDAAAHRAALAAGGRTVGVLGCGLDRTYPAEHLDLAREMQAAGAVVSEFPVGVPPLPHHFPLRNRIISGLSVAVVVVEAPEKSGALITASAAADQGRDVLVVPGSAAGGRNRGGHLLIRDGAKVVETVDDIVQELDLAAAAPRVATVTGHLPDVAEFTLDEVAARSGETPSVVLARLMELELAGRIQRIGGGRYVRVLT